jgi:hypothetical protein
MLNRSTWQSTALIGITSALRDLHCDHEHLSDIIDKLIEWVHSIHTYVLSISPLVILPSAVLSLFSARCAVLAYVSNSLIITVSLSLQAHAGVGDGGSPTICVQVSTVRQGLMIAHLPVSVVCCLLPVVCCLLFCLCLTLCMLKMF